MSSIRKTIEETVKKLKATLLNEEDPAAQAPKGSYDTDAMRARRERGNENPEIVAQRAKASANSYADRLSGTDRIKADSIIKNTLLKGYSGAIDASWITDLDSRWTKNPEGGYGKRISFDTPKTISYDYIIQMLGSLYNTPDGKPIEIGGQQLIDTKGNPILMSSNIKSNVYEGLLKMFDLQDKDGRWKWFTFGSNIPGVSLVPSTYRPKISIKPDGTLDFDEVDEYMKYLNFWLKSGQLQNILKKGGFYDKGFAYVITAIRNKYIELKVNEGRKRQAKQSYDAYTDPNYSVNMSDPSMLGAKKDLGGKIDSTMDLRYLGTKDRGEDPGHNSITRFVNTLKVDIAGASDLDMEDSEREGMAKLIGGKLLDFVNSYYADKPYIIDLFKAKLSRNPASLNDITNPEYAEMYPHAQAAFAGKPRNYPQVYFRNAYQKAIKPEADNLEAQYIKQMDIDAKPTGASSDWKEKGGSGEEKEKLSYSDYANPNAMVKRVNKVTGKPETFDDYGDYWNSLEETEGGSDKAAKLSAVVMNAVDNFFLND